MIILKKFKSYYESYMNYWFPVISEEDKEDFQNNLVYMNIFRLRLVTWPLIVVLILISPIVARTSYIGIVFQIILIFVLLVFQATTVLPSSPKDLKPHHKFFDRYLLPLILLTYTVNTAGYIASSASIQIIPPVMGIMIAMFSSAAFLYIPLPRSILMYFLTSVILIALSWFYMLPSIALTNTINMTFLALLSIIMSRMVYVMHFQNYFKEKLIEQQKNDLIKANNMLYAMSYIDPLTGIPNRRYFDEILKREWNRAAREQNQLALIMIDVDFFKKYNDHFGHQAGDNCLRLIAKAISKTVNRPGDIVARYGGEEFAVILPNTNTSGARQIAENIFRAVKNLKIRHPSSPYNFLTVSLGFSSRKPQNEKKETTLLSAADIALYQAKKSGRNRYVQIP